MEKLLDELLPILDVEHNMILSRQGDVTIVFKAQMPEIFTLSEQQYDAFHQSWVKAIKVLPCGVVLHKQDWFLREEFMATPGSSASFLTRSSDSFFQGRPFLSHECYVMLTKSADERKSSSSLTSNLFRRSIVPSQTLSKALLDDFLDSAGQFKRILEDSGFASLTQLEDHQLLSQQRRAGLIEKYAFLLANCQESMLGDISFERGIQVADKLCSLYTLADADQLPGFCSASSTYERYSTDRTKFSVGFASLLGQLLACNHIYNQYVFTSPSEKTLKKLESKRLRLQSLSIYARENSLALDATNDFLNEAIREQRLPVKAHFNVLAWTQDHGSVKELKSMVSSALAQLDTSAKLETSGAPQIFWAGIPGNAADFPINDTFDTFAEQAACFFNLEGPYRSSPGSFGIRLGDRLTGKPVLVDISDEPVRTGICTNRNKFILGPSGSGKSFFTNHMVRSYFESGAHIVLVDVGHSYKGLCDMLSGYYFTYQENNPIRFNPFYIAKGDVLDTEKKESIKTLLLALWKKDDETFKRSEYVALSVALTQYYDYLASRDIFPCFDSFYEFLQTQYTNVLKKDQVKEKDFDMSNFLYVLRPYFRGGEFDYLLNAKQNIDLLSERLIVFELDNIKDHPILFPIVTIIIMEVFISKMRKLTGIRKVILIEEAWVRRDAA
ncbi:TraG family conjugative transposon ATPase [Dyadobacter sp. 50-39]|uniref:TraG family conjugative transposon ATPase n=1 Tax=Dyadobacter sp. 50-39 TaxID=1895756 RepID=UPI000A641D1A|nr:TraG family conjugative transposon ATPase [Dyadobacter sp. 50-39]